MQTRVYLLLIYTVFLFPLPVISQCLLTPQASITGAGCVSSELRLNTNVMPESIEWQLNGMVISTQNALPSVNATTVAGGNGAGAGPAQFQNADRIFVDAGGIIYVADQFNNRVQKWMPGATTGVTVAGGNGVGNAPNQLSRPSSVFVDDAGNVFVADQGNG